jgi:hypothetical protein
MSHRKTIFSPDRRHRYTLWREWIGGNGYAMFVGLNPSTADEVQDDPTIRRCIAYAKRWGYAGYCMTNIFAFRATDPRVMFAAPDPIGAENDHYLVECAKGAGIVVAAWGAHGAYMNRGAAVAQLLPDLHYLRLTKGGFPGHPLYLPSRLVPTPWPKDQRPLIPPETLP